ncbi:MAG TPA: hypothetical protein VGG76_12890 [Gemmatimonadaceae bacterium]|jgi:hypothetical protein
MSNRSLSFITFAGVLILAMACSGDNPTSPSSLDPQPPLASAIKSDIAAAAGNAIASDLETLIANEAAAAGSFGLSSPARAFDGESADSTPSSNPPTQPNCTAGEQPGVFLCAKQPGPGEHLSCTFSAERNVYVCVTPVQPAQPDSAQPPPAPAPASSEPCSFDSSNLVYSCVSTSEGKTVVKSYQFLDANGNPMEKFVHGTTEAIHYLLKSDESVVKDNGSSVSHSLRDVTLSGFLGPNRIWNGFGSSADTTVHKEELSTRKYSGLSVDTLQAVAFVDQRALHPYPLSGVAIRVVGYAVVSSGAQLETTTVHKRVVVTFNGTADVPISLGDYSCVLHLDTHKVDGCK